MAGRSLLKTGGDPVSEPFAESLYWQQAAAKLEVQLTEMRQSLSQIVETCGGRPELAEIKDIARRGLGQPD